jgi:hypothetical protein
MAEKVVALIDKGKNSKMWTAEQMLTELLEEVKAGKVNPEKIIVLFWEPTQDRRLRKSSRCVNFTNADYVAFLASAAHDALHEWQDDR